LAFISEFNLQILYLSGLKNIIPDFLSRPLPPPEPSETDAAAAEADPVDFKAMAAEQNCCTETQRLLAVHPSNLLSNKQALNACWQYFPGSFSSIVPAKFR
jgi:hypothetical protein